MHIEELIITNLKLQVKLKLKFILPCMPFLFRFKPSAMKSNKPKETPRKAVNMQMEVKKAKPWLFPVLFALACAAALTFLLGQWFASI